MKYLLVTLILIGALLLLLSPVLSQSNVMPPGFHDDLSGYFSYSGVGWRYGTHNDYFEGGSFWTPTFGDEFSFKFYGHSFVYFYYGGNTNDSVNICVDGSCGIYPLMLSGGARQNISFSGLSNSEHTVVISKASNNANWINVDGVRVGGEFPETTPEIVLNVTIPPVEVTVEVVAPTPQWRSEWEVNDGEGGEQTVAFDYQISAGEVAITMALILLTILLGIHVFTNQWRQE